MTPIHYPNTVFYDVEAMGFPELMSFWKSLADKENFMQMVQMPDFVARRMDI